MSVTIRILSLLADGGKGMDEAILVANAMQRGDDARRVFDLLEVIEKQDRTPEDLATVLVIYAEALIQEAKRQAYQSTKTTAAAGPKERWGYEGPITPRLPEKEWWPLRNSVLERDAYTCTYCGEQSQRMCADHVVPLSRGGSNDPTNLVACCIPCNSSKADRLLEEWEGRYR